MEWPRSKMAPLVTGFLAGDLEEFAEKLTDKTLSYVSPDVMRVRIKALRVVMYSIASELKET